MLCAVIGEGPRSREGMRKPAARSEVRRVPNSCVIGRGCVRLLSDVLAVHPRHGGAHRHFDRVRMKYEVSDGDDKVRRINNSDGDLAFPRAGGAGASAAVRKTGDNDSARAQHHERCFEGEIHGCLTTTTPFMKGCGVQWKAYSPGCVNV